MVVLIPAALLVCLADLGDPPSALAKGGSVTPFVPYIRYFGGALSAVESERLAAAKGSIDYQVELYLAS